MLHKYNAVKHGKTTDSPALKIYNSAYESCKFYEVDNGMRIVPISYTIFTDIEE